MCLRRAQVHKLAIFDMRLLNTDRNDGNVLVTRLPEQRAPSRKLPLSRARGDRLEGVDRNGTDFTTKLGANASHDEESEGSLTDPDDDQEAASQEKAIAGGSHLVPIDHGLVLPTRPEVVWYNWCWLSWPQMGSPLSASSRAYIKSLDPIADAKAIVDAGLPASCARVCRCATYALQRGVEFDLTLHDIAQMLSRKV